MRASLFVRMTAPVVIVSVLLLFLGIFTAWYILRLQQEAATVLSLNVASIRAAEELEIGMREIRTRINQFLLTGDRQHLSAIPELRRDTDRWLEAAHKLATTQHEEHLTEAMKRGYQHFFRQFDELPNSPGDETSRELRDLVDDVLTREILQPAHEYLDFNEQMIQSSSQRGQAMAKRMALGLLILSTCGPLAGLLAGFAIARRVSQTLVQLTVPVHDAAGKLNEVVGPITVSAASDIDELEGLLRKLADHVTTVVDRLQQSQREVLRTEQLAAVGQLAAGVAHELRNPLQSIQLLVQSALEEDDDAGCLEGHDLLVLQDAVGRVKRSVQTFLDFARPPTLEKRLLYLDDIVRQTMDLVTGRAKRQGVELRSNLPRHEVQIEADADQMRQLVLNLLLNALDAVSGPGRVWVELRANPKSSDQAREKIELDVCDTGVGLPTELGQRIFDPFVTSKETGVGLGLPICKRIVEAHGGTIQAVNGTDGGACFKVTLPALTYSNAIPLAV